MTENTQIDETAGTDVNDAPVTEYTSESDTNVAGAEPVARPAATLPRPATGRRQEGAARLPGGRDAPHPGFRAVRTGGARQVPRLP